MERIVIEADGTEVGTHKFSGKLRPVGREALRVEKHSDLERWSHFLTQPAKVDSPMRRMIHHENAETVFG